MTLDELLVGLGYEYEDEDLENFKSDIADTVDIVKSLITVALAGAAALTTMTVASARASDEQGKLAEEIGETVETVSALEFAMRKVGGESSDMGSALSQLSIRASEAARGIGSGVEAFGMLGISVTDANGRLKSSSNLMLEVSGQLQGLDRAQQIELSDKLGLGSAIRLLQKGPSAIRDLVKEAKALGVTTAEDAALSAEFNESMVALWQIIKDVSRTITRIFIPSTTAMVQTFVDWWKANKALIEQNLPRWIDMATRAFKFLSIAIAAFLAMRVIAHVATLIAMMKGLTIATLAFNVAALLLPALITAAITAFLLLMDEAKVFFEGGDTLLGEWLEKFPEWEGLIKGVLGTFKLINDTTGLILKGWKEIFALFEDSDLSVVGKILNPKEGSMQDRAMPMGGRIVRGILNASKGDNPSGVQNIIDKIEIKIEAGISNAEEIARSVRNQFQQATQELDTAVEQ